MTKHIRTAARVRPPAKPGRKHDVVLLLPRVLDPAPTPGARLPHGTAPDDEEPGEDARDEPLPRLLSAAAVARIFNRSERAIRNWTQRGYLRPVRIGRSLFFRETDIRRLVAGQLSRNVQAHAPGRVEGSVA